MAEFSGLMSEEEQRELKDAFKKDGVTGCIRHFERKSEEWKAVPLKVGVIGNSGSGKSSFINTIRGLEANTPGAAAVDVEEETLEPTEYLHPNNTMLAFWDLPGVGTPWFPRDTYLEKVEMESYDCFVIITAGKFTETDVWIVKEISKRKKHFYFIRSKIGIDIDNDKHNKRQDHNEEEVVQRIRQNTTEKLKKESFNDPVFLIHNHLPHKYDFDELKQTIVKDLPVLKRRAMLLSLPAFSESMIKMKVKELHNRTWISALWSAANAWEHPENGFSFPFTVELLLSELKFYYKQLGLDEDSLKQRAQHMGVDYQTLNKIVELAYYIPIPQAIGMQLLKIVQVSAYAAATMLEEMCKDLPIIGSLVAAPLSLWFTKFALNYMLDKMEKISIELTQYYEVDESIDE